MKRVSFDRARYLDLTHPGRIHHFISFTDLLYWERFQLLKSQHEIARGKMTTFSPIARFPNTISVFHYFATKPQVLTAVRDAMQVALNERRDDARVKLLPLVFLHSSPLLNKNGKKTTPIHIALDKNSPVSFEIMIQQLVDQRKVCVTSQLIDVLEIIINSPSQSVLEFFNNSFYITDQFDGPRALEWDDQSIDEKIVAVSTAYLTAEYMQSLTSKKAMDGDLVEAEMELVPDHIHEDDEEDAPVPYSEAVETVTHENDDESNLKQVEAKVLDFNWVFTSDNAARLVKILADSSNDEIFATDQIRVFVDFMWEGYFYAILDNLFIPFCFYFLAFILYSGYFSHQESDQLSWIFVGEICCLVTFGKMFVTFTVLEIIQLRSTGISYFYNMWNLIDFSSLIINAVYVACELTNALPFGKLQLIATVATLLLWVKFFYWMRLFRPFSAFIRMIAEILIDIRVFMVMLMLCLAAFANIVYLLNDNRD